MVCQIMAGSLPLSAIGALRVITSALPRLGYYRPYHTVAAVRSTSPRWYTARDLAKPSAVRETVPYRSPITVPPKTTQGINARERARPPAPANHQSQWHRPLLRDFRRSGRGTAAADHGARRP